MSYEDTIWINQELYSFTDYKFNSNSTLGLTLSTSTQDHQHFTSPNLLLSIRSKSDSRSRNCTIGYGSAQDFLISALKVLSNIDLAYNQATSIDKKFGKDKFLKIVFKRSQSTQEQCVVISIVYSDTDYSLTIMNVTEFGALVELIKNYTDNYIDIALGLQKKDNNSIIMRELADIKNGIRMLPSQLNIQTTNVNETNVSNNASTTASTEPTLEEMIALKEQAEEADADGGLINEFETFSEENIDKVSIPELDIVEKEADNPPKEAEKDLVIESDFIDKVLKGSIENFETLMNNIYHDSNPIFSFTKMIENEMDITNFFPGITENEMKSASYISKILFRSFFVNYVEHGKPIPSSCPVIKYKAVEATEKHIEFAYDLLTISGYIKCLRSKLEHKVSDSDSNKAIVNIAVRCFTDLFTFSFLDSKNKDGIKNCILARFRNFHQSGFFDHYEKACDLYACNKVTERDMGEFLDNVSEKIIGKAKPITELHESMYNDGHVKLPSVNKFNIEQILNTLIEIEVSVKLGKDVKSLTTDKDLITLFSTKSKKVSNKAPVTKVSNLGRFINEVDFIKQIPERFRTEFTKHITELQDDYDFLNAEFPIEELGDDIVKAVYVWNESDNKKEKYTDFRSKIENSADKEFIISKIRGTKDLKDTTGSEGDWSGISDLSFE